MLDNSLFIASENSEKSSEKQVLLFGACRKSALNFKTHAGQVAVQKIKVGGAFKINTAGVRSVIYLCMYGSSM